MDKYQNNLESYNYFKSDISEDELLIQLKRKIMKGHFRQFKDCTDRELLKVAKVVKPFITFKLEIANDLARE